MKQDDALREELRRWFFSALVFMPVLVVPVSAWQGYLLFELRAFAGQPSLADLDFAIWNSAGVLGECALLCAKILSCLLLWHLPLMLRPHTTHDRWYADRSGHVLLLAVLSVLFVPMVWDFFETANCLHRLGLHVELAELDPGPKTWLEFQEPVCSESRQTSKLVANVYWGLVAALLARAAILFRIAPRQSVTG